METEDRRRLFWLTFIIDQAVASATARGYTLLNLKDIDTLLPQDVAVSANLSLSHT